MLFLFLDFTLKLRMERKEKILAKPEVNERNEME